MSVGDWPALGLWIAASLVAVSLLGLTMSRRREALTETLRQHVARTVGPPQASAEREPAASGEAAERAAEQAGDQ